MPTPPQRVCPKPLEIILRDDIKEIREVEKHFAVPAQPPPAPEVEPEPPPGEVDIVLFVDTETTGFGNSACVVEIALVCAHYHGTRLIKSKAFSSLVNPGMDIPADATAVHHITDAMVADAPMPHELYTDIGALVEGARYFVAHSAHFDKRMLSNNFGEVFNTDGQGFVLPVMIDTLTMAKKLYHNAPDHKLETLHKYLKLPTPDGEPHRALFDTLVAQNLFEHMLTGFRSVRDMSLRYGKETRCGERPLPGCPQPPPTQRKR